MSKEKASSRISNNTGRSGRKSFSPVLLIVPMLIVAAVGIFIFVLTREEPDKNVVVTPDNIEEVISKLSEEAKTPQGSYEVRMSTTWKFEDGKAASETAFVENVPNNRNTVYFVICLKDTEEEIYKSPYIPVGSSLSNIVLDKPLDKGTYNAVMTYYLVDDSNKDVSRVSVGLTLIIEQ